MEELMTGMDAQMKSLPQSVQLWMNWMVLIFLSSFVFVWKHKEARWTVLVLLLSMPGALLVFYLTRNVHLIALVHLIFWTPLAIYLMKAIVRSEKFQRWSLLRVWHHLLVATILVSLIFDLRDLYLVARGLK